MSTNTIEIYAKIAKQQNSEKFNKQMMKLKST